MNAPIVLCEIANEIEAECVCEPSQFMYAKKGWQLMDCFAENTHAEILIECIKKCEALRPRKLVFKAIKKDGKWILVLLQKVSHAKVCPLDMEMGATLLPIVFKNFRLETSLDFVVAEQEKIYQRPLKTYVTTKLFDALYDRHQKVREGKDKPLNLPDCFQSRLRKYQERSVCWMLSREQELNEFTGNYSILLAVDGHTRVVKHDYCLEFYPFQEELQKIALPPGGILADEMGLGKTVEFLAMLMLNPRVKGTFNNKYWLELLESVDENVPRKQQRLQDDLFCICTKKKGIRIQCSKCRLWQHERCMSRSVQQDANDPPYVCPSCWSELGDMGNTHLVESGTTIIVSPNAIKMQWFNEMKKHISPALKVLLYPGLHSGTWYSPLDLAKYDVVLTDYLILRNEIYHTADYKSDRQMRHQQRYMRPSCPLLMVNWWRVCLDEAQMVESNTSQAAEMVRMLPAVNRWAVTGTIDDLPPLLQFVGFNEACQPPAAWQTVDKSFQLNHNPKPLLDLLEHSLWRTCMSKVNHELGIPPQTEVVHRLELSNVEALYYSEEHDKCHDQFRKEVAKNTHHNDDNSARLAAISSQLLRSILKPFLHIRKTCSVPFVHNNNNVHASNFLDPQDLLDHLITNNETECKKELRSWASSYNGTAAIFFIRKRYSMAITQYKLLLKLAADYNKDNISVDSVLQIHALYNILEANTLAAPQDKISEIEVTTYQAQMKALEWKYLDDTSKVLQSADNAYQSKITECHNLNDQFSDIVEFMSTVVHHEPSLHVAIWNKVREEFIRQNISADKFAHVDTVWGILYDLEMWHGRFEDLKTNLIEEFEYLKDIIGRAVSTVQAGDALAADITNFIGQVSDCHLAEILDDDDKKKPKKPRTCRLCKIRETLHKFECELFDKENDENEGLEKPSTMIALIKIILTFVRGKPEFRDYRDECKVQLDFLSSLQGLAKAMAKYWIEVEYMVKSFDELEMCKMRIQLTADPKEQSNYRILRGEVAEHLEANLSNLDMSQLNFARLCGRLKYLKHLKEDKSAKVCPICQTDEDSRYVMMVCGHFICKHCLDVMKKKITYEGRTKCPTCRQVSPQLYHSIRPGETKSIVGNFSTKIACMVELILKISAAGNKEKILIFSQWQPILEHISTALKLNGIEYRKCSNKDLEEFKSTENNVTCLLMPLSRGSKGLNLIEATHVFLVEPILNPGDERQAIGRIHRFGQTKATTVHRFVMNGTIEENILTLITSADDSETFGTHWDLGNMTLDSLKKLFVLK
ncbi:E3 ubiquitin-protein ligase SHPRH isoform X2 [Drosophila obscura]|uniref:E3 ubiquitin-protein ligase SHPRH isoform X2 n=1 Tax=Drosophila obscura TaxID=7282 RepID=UPI001BB17B54|nr:E3 ubiquitin-protein ligase SHPRH isoform X2 [Drosophila obscura]